MRPITIRERWAIEYDHAFTQWLSLFDRKSTDPQVLVFDHLMKIPSLEAHRIANIVREGVEYE